MSVFYDEASLVLVPSGYKASKVYAQKPLTADGQLTFSRASTATRVNASGLIETVASNVPRLDYLGSTCPKLQLEPSRTNLALYSETITAGTGATVSLDNATSPDGYVNADKLVEDTSTGFHRTSFTTSLGGSVDSSAYCISIFAKAAGRTRFAFWDNSQDESGYSYFDLSNGTVIGGTGKIENYGNGWYRCSIFPLKNFSTNSSGFINLVSTGTTESYTGNGTSGVLFWGKQLEIAAYATSYIPTTAAAVTRLADFASKTGIVSLIGQSEGTVFVEVDIRNTVDVSRIPIAISSPNPGTSTSEAYFFINGSGNLVFELITAGIPQCGISAGPVQLGVQKLALAYKNNDFVFYRNGQFVGDDGTGTVASGFDQISLGSYTSGSAEFNDRINQALLFKTRLTNAQLAELTSL